MAAVVSCALLVGALGLQLVLPYTEAPSGQGGLAPRRPRLVTVPPLPEYAAIQQAPLFAPDRHPGETSASGPGGGDLDGYAVLGVAVGRSGAAAVVAAPGAPVKSVKAGETIGGWRLVAVSRSQVTFEKNGSRRSLVVGAPAIEGRTAAQDSGAAADADESDDK